MNDEDDQSLDELDYMLSEQLVRQSLHGLPQETLAKMGYGVSETLMGQVQCGRRSALELHL